MKTRSAIIIFFVTILYLAFPIKLQKHVSMLSQICNSGTGCTRISYSELYADEKKEKNPVKSETPVMEEEASESGKLFRVMMVVMVIWLGLAYYLFRLDRKITKLEKDIHEL